MRQQGRRPCVGRERRRNRSSAHACADCSCSRLASYISTVAIEALLQEVLKMLADERAELVARLIDSISDDQVELSAEEVAELDEATTSANRAVERGELIPA